jgi:hypothetical protein
MHLSSRSLCACVLLAAGTVFVFSGCEDEDTDVDAIGDYQSSARDAQSPPSETETTGEELSVSPTTVTLDQNGDMASLTAKGGTAPYSWAVQDVFRGSIVDAGGSSAAYQRSSAGDNAVAVTDAAGSKAYAIIEQP